MGGKVSVAEVKLEVLFAVWLSVLYAWGGG